MIFTTISEARKQTNLSYLGMINSSAKMMKSKKVNQQYTYIIYLAPANTSGYNVCSHSTPECRLGCLATSGRAGMEINKDVKPIEYARIKKSKLFFEQREFFMSWLVAEIKASQAKAVKDGFYFSVRLNGTSDIDWENIIFDGKNIFEIFPDVSFYDYTKNHLKFNSKPKNNHLTYSFTGRNWLVSNALLKEGHNVAVVFNVKKETDLPKTYKGYKVINGDLTDYRIADAKGIIIGLKFKRIGNKKVNDEIINSKFVVQANDINCTY